MKVLDEITELLCSGRINHRVNSQQIWFLEEEDFDTAIQLLIKFNKKNAVKEYQLLKEEFVADELSHYEKDPSGFVRNLVETATKRMSAVEARRIRKEIAEKFPSDVRQQYNEVILKLGTIFFDALHHNHYAEYHKKLCVIYDQKASAIQEWINQQEAQGISLKEMSAADFEEILQVLQEIGDANGEKEIEEARWMKLD
jgi:hypothetical protein